MTCRTILPATALTLGASLVAAFSPASAQASGAEPAIAQAPPGASAGVVDIVVTAQRRNESLQRTPVAVTAISAAELRSQNITTVTDLARIAPNVTISTFSYNAPTNTVPIIYIRGIGQQDPAIYSDPGVPIYADGVYVARSAGGAIDLPDIQRVEVLRGPQGTLFGKNAVGGAVDVITRTPGVDPETRLWASAGSYKYLEGRGYTDLRLTDTLAATLAFDAKREDGYGKRLDRAGNEIGRLGDQRHFSVRGRVRWTPTDALTIDVSADHTRYNDTAAPSQTLVVTSSNVLTQYNNRVGIPAGAPVVQQFAGSGRYDNYAENPSPAVDKIDGVAATVAYDFGGATLKSITAYRVTRSRFSRDADSGPVNYFEVSRSGRQRQFTQELQLYGSALAGHVDYIAGIFYLHDNSYENNTLFVAPGLYNATRIGNFDISRDYFDTQITNSIAGFAQATWHIVPGLNFTAGVRYTKDKKDVTVFVDSPDSGIVYVTKRPLSDKWKAWTPRFALDYQLSRNVLLYASAARGFKSGGFNERPSNLLALTEFYPEALWSYEVGLKADLFDRVLRTNFALYRSDYSNIQLTRQVLINGQVVSDINNVAAARIQGFEAEVTLVPVHGLQLSANVGYTDTKYTKLQAGAIVRATDRIPYVSDWTVNLSGSYRIRLGAAGSLTPSVNYAYRTGAYVQPRNTDFSYLPARGLLSGRLTFAPAGDRFEISVFGTNLTDKRYLQSVGDSSGAGNVYLLFGRPRELGVQVGAHF